MDRLTMALKEKLLKNIPKVYGNKDITKLSKSRREELINIIEQDINQIKNIDK